MLMKPSMQPLVEDFPALLGSPDGINAASDPSLHNHHVLMLCESCGPSTHLLLLARLFIEIIIEQWLAENVHMGIHLRPMRVLGNVLGTRRAQILIIVLGIAIMVISGAFIAVVLFMNVGGTVGDHCLHDLNG